MCSDPLQIIMILMLQVFKAFEGSLGVYGDGEGNIRSTLHGQAEGGDYDNHNVTYTEKVGPGHGAGRGVVTKCCRRLIGEVVQ